MVKVSNNTTFKKKRTFDSWLIGSADTEPTDASGRLYMDVSLGEKGNLLSFLSIYECKI